MYMYRLQYWFMSCGADELLRHISHQSILSGLAGTTVSVNAKYTVDDTLSVFLSC